MNIKSFARRQGPTVLMAAGLASFTAAVITGIKAGKRVDDILKETGDAPVQEKVRALLPVLAPTLGFAFAGAGMIFASHDLQNRKIAGLVAGLGIAEAQIRRFGEAVVAEIGQKKADKIRYATTEPSTDPSPTLSELYDAGEAPIIFWDQYSGRYYSGPSVEWLQQAVAEMNDLLYGEDWVSLHDYFDAVNLDQTEYSNDVGWNQSNGPVRLQLDSFLKDGRPVVSVSFERRPFHWDILNN